MCHKIKFLFIFLLLNVVYGCSSNAIKSELKVLFDSKIEIPDKIIRFEGALAVCSYDSLFLKPCLISYIDSTGCPLCRIHNLTRFSDIVEESEKSGAFNIMFIVGPKQVDSFDVVQELMTEENNYVIYYDINSEFLKMNKAIPKDIRFHTMLLDENRYPL